MKKMTLLLLAVFTLINTLEIMAQSEFSSNTIGIGVVVTDLEKSLEFYTGVIGMVKTGEFDVDADMGKSSGLSDGVPFHVDVLKLEDSPGANQWKLMSFNNKPGHPSPKHIQDDTGVQYITINVNSLKPFLERIQKHNVKLLGDTPMPLGAENHFVLVQDPDGTMVELIGPLE